MQRQRERGDREREVQRRATVSDTHHHPDAPVGESDRCGVPIPLEVEGDGHVLDRRVVRLPRTLLHIRTARRRGVVGEKRHVVDFVRRTRRRRKRRNRWPGRVWLPIANVLWPMDRDSVAECKDDDFVIRGADRLRVVGPRRDDLEFFLIRARRRCEWRRCEHNLAVRRPVAQRATMRHFSGKQHPLLAAIAARGWEAERIATPARSHITRRGAGVLAMEGARRRCGQQVQPRAVVVRPAFIANALRGSRVADAV